ncbi:hypothetical protein KBB42_01925 [Candidatus Dojkabacteria bacterium]|nr:hypothetical protein [Candidatus Dojkabacteria bacterium]
MGDEELKEIKVVSIENLMPQRDIEVDGVMHRVYLEEQVKGMDRCFAYSDPNDPSNIRLFRITTEIINNQPLSIQYLSELDINDDNTVRDLFNIAHQIYLETKGTLSEKDATVPNLSKTIAIGSKNYSIMYQPPTTGEFNMREQYKRKVMNRIYG